MHGVTKIQFRATFVLTFYNKNVQKYLFKNVKSDVSYTRGQDSGNSSMSRIVCTSYFPLPFPGGVACALKTDYGNFVLVRLPAYLQRRLQSVLNAAARLVFHLSRYDHVSDALATLRWLRLPQRVDFKAAVVAFHVVHGLAPPYPNDLVRVADLPGRRRLRSSSHQLIVPPFRLTTVGRRTFPVAASLLCNSLPSDIQSSTSLPVFRQRLKTFLFRQCFPNIVNVNVSVNMEFKVTLHEQVRHRGTLHY